MTTTNRILLKKSSVEGKIPSASDVEFGELALNFSDGRLYFKNSDNNVDFFESGGFSSTLPFAANESNFGSVTNLTNEFSFNLGNINQVETFSHDLGDVRSVEEGEEVALGLNSYFNEDANFGNISESVTETNILGNIADSTENTFSLGNVSVTGVFVNPSSFILPSSTVSNLPDGITGQMLFVTDEVNGAAPAFYDGNNWKRLSDNQTVTAT